MEGNALFLNLNILKFFHANRLFSWLMFCLRFIGGAVWRGLDPPLTLEFKRKPISADTAAWVRDRLFGVPCPLF
jgi:hypothetical protein